jgi:hypothetical protein
MITLLGGFDPGVIAVACSGHVTRADYETVLVPAVEAALKTHEHVRVYYEVRADFAGIEPGAVWEDFSIGMRHLPHWERMAVVTDVGWIKLAIHAFGFLMPGKVRIFALGEETQAKAWLGER